MKMNLLKLIMSGEIYTEDMLMSILNIDENQLENLLDQLENDGYLETNNEFFKDYFEGCDKNKGNCSAGGCGTGSCSGCDKNKSAELYTPDEKVKKIRIATPQAIHWAFTNNITIKE